MTKTLIQELKEIMLQATKEKIYDEELYCIQDAFKVAVEERKIISKQERIKFYQETANYLEKISENNSYYIQNSNEQTLLKNVIGIIRKLE